MTSHNLYLLFYRAFALTNQNLVFGEGASAYGVDPAIGRFL